MNYKIDSRISPTVRRVLTGEETSEIVNLLVSRAAEEFDKSPYQPGVVESYEMTSPMKAGMDGSGETLLTIRSIAGRDGVDHITVLIGTKEEMERLRRRDETLKADRIAFRN